jgi:hypothetical protein
MFLFCSFLLLTITTSSPTQVENKSESGDSKNIKSSGSTPTTKSKSRNNRGGLGQPLGGKFKVQTGVTLFSVMAAQPRLAAGLSAGYLISLWQGISVEGRFSWTKGQWDSDCLVDDYTTTEGGLYLLLYPDISLKKKGFTAYLKGGMGLKHNTFTENQVEPCTVGTIKGTTDVVVGEVGVGIAWHMDNQISKSLTWGLRFELYFQPKLKILTQPKCTTCVSASDSSIGARLGLSLFF